MSENYISICVTSNDLNKRLDKFLSEKIDHLSRRRIQSIIVNESTWTDSNGDYGIVICLGTIDKFLDKSVVLNLGCSGRNQDDEKFTGNIVRKSDAQDAGVGVFTYVDGTGKFERMIGRKCNLAVRYIDEFTFYRHRCK